MYIVLETTAAGCMSYELIVSLCITSELYLLMKA